MIEPGASASVDVSATPFPVGERTVAITLNTDSPVTPKIHLQLRMIGSRRPPFLLAVDGSLAFSRRGGPDESLAVSVFTIEPSRRDGEPVIRSDIPALIFERVGLEEKPWNDPGLFQRRYLFRARLQGGPTGTISGTASIADPWEPARVETISVYRPDSANLRLFPSRVVFHADPGPPNEASAQFSLMMSDPEDSIEVDAGTGPFRVERLDADSRGRMIAYRLRSATGAAIPAGEYSISARVGSDPARLAIPVEVRYGAETR